MHTTVERAGFAKPVPPVNEPINSAQIVERLDIRSATVREFKCHEYLLEDPDPREIRSLHECKKSFC